MAKVVRSEDCGNSPKNALVEALAIALALADVAEVRARVTDDVERAHAGGETVRGKDALAAAVRAGQRRVAKLTIDQVCTHGRAGAVNGTIEYRSGATIEFCQVFTFANTKGTAVSRITSYQIG
jgi:hypothetical protein